MSEKEGDTSAQSSSPIASIGEKIQGAAIVTANELVPNVPKKQVESASREIGSKVGATAAAAGTAAAMLGIGIIKKVKKDKKFRKAASKLGYTILKTTKDGILFAVKNASTVGKPAKKMVKRGFKLAFVPIKTLGVIAINAALVAASAIPPVAIALKLSSTASKLGWQLYRGITLVGGVSTSALKMGNNILELMINSSGVIPKMIKNLKKIGLQAKDLVKSVNVPLPPIPALHISIPNPINFISGKLSKIPNPAMPKLPSIIPSNLGDIKIGEIPKKLGKTLDPKAMVQAIHEADPKVQAAKSGGKRRRTRKNRKNRKKRRKRGYSTKKRHYRRRKNTTKSRRR